MMDIGPGKLLMKLCVPVCTMPVLPVCTIRVRKWGGSDNYGHENSLYRFVFGYLVYKGCSGWCQKSSKNS